MWRAVRTPRRGSAYVMVLGCTLFLLLLGTSAAVQMLQTRRTAENSLAPAQARLHARSAIELGLLIMAQNADWRTARTCGVWADKEPIGTGAYTLVVTESDGDLNEADVCAIPQTDKEPFSPVPSDSVVFTACGYQRGARQVLQVTLAPDRDNADPFADAISALGPVAWWRLGDSSTMATDAMGVHDGTYRNGPLTGQQVPFRSDTAVYFDGVDDLVEIPHNNAFLVDNGSILLWFCPVGRLSGIQGLFSKAWKQNNTGGDVTIWLEGNVVHVGIESTSDLFHLYGGSVSLNQWYQTVFTFGSGGIHLFVNGGEVASYTYTGGLGRTSGGVGNTEPIALGVTLGASEYHSISGWTYPFRGCIDEVAFFNRALSPEEVATLYTLGSMTAPATSSMHVKPGSWRLVTDN